MVDEIRADRIVAPGEECDLQLGSDAVGARHQHRILEPIAEPEQPAERPDVGHDAGRERAAGERPDAPDGLVARVDVYTGSLVVHFPFSQGPAPSA
jgi:hypothetical protein